MKRLLLALIALAALGSALYLPDDEATVKERSKDRFEL